jgi:hypothetical protein
VYVAPAGMTFRHNESAEAKSLKSNPSSLIFWLKVAAFILFLHGKHQQIWYTSGFATTFAVRRADLELHFFDFQNRFFV